ncbi:MAG: hypothetical protein M5U31_16110 [Acidimicrobiia bacterium]|nr:hypothetical protein [Acidimicrobiia bacterium]
MDGVLKVLVPGLDECWALDLHWDPALGARSRIGDLVYRAKYHREPEARDRLADEMISGVQSLVDLTRSAVRRGQVVIGVPAVDGGDSALPTYLAARVADATEMRREPGLLVRVAQRQKVKFAAHQDRNAVVTGAFVCSRAVPGTVVVVIDDLVQSGATLGEAARVLRAAGASRVIGFAATRVAKGMVM